MKVMFDWTGAVRLVGFMTSIIFERILMFYGKSKKQLCEEWLAAADTFCRAQVPNVGNFMHRTDYAYWGVLDRRFNLAEMAHVAEEMTEIGARPRRDIGDAVYVKSVTLMSMLYIASSRLLKECQQTGCIPESEDLEPRSRLIDDTIKRRRRQLKVKQVWCFQR